LFKAVASSDFKIPNLLSNTPDNRQTDNVPTEPILYI